MKTGRGSWTHIVYLTVIAIKGIDGVIETLLGLLIAVAGPERLYLFVLHFTTPELEDNPGNHLAKAVQAGATGFVHASSRFAIFYLLVHGLLKTGIAASLLRGKRWIFLPAVVILGGFVVFLSYHAAVRWSGWSFGFALFDLFTLALVVNEWIRPDTGHSALEPKAPATQIGGHTETLARDPSR